MATPYSKDKIKSKLGWSNAFNPDGAFPLDIRAYFGSYEEAVSAANTAQDFGSTASQYYLGQQLYVFDGTTTKTYLIQGDKSLKEIGSNNSPMIFVSSESEMLGLTDIVSGQQVYREDTKSIWIYKGTDPASLSNWAESASQNDTVWYGTTNKVNFYALTYADYSGISQPSADTLYFITDQGKIFKGSVDMSSCIAPVTALPAVADAVPGKLYIDSNSLAIKLTQDNQSWLVASPGYLTDGANWAQADGNKLATISLIKKGISATLSQISFDSATGNITFGSEISTTLSGVAHSPEYNSNELKLTIPVYGADPIVVNIPKDKFVKSGTYNSATHNIELTLQGESTPILIPAAELVDVYVADNSSTNIKVAVSDDNKISATLTIDPSTSNRLKYDAKTGFSVDVSDKIGLVPNPTENNIVTLAADGSIKDSTVKIGSDVFESQPSDKTVATESAVKHCIDDTLSWTSISQ